MKLELREVTRRQGANFELKVDLTATGNVIGILGQSGSGKTTLLEIVAGLRRADAGAVVLDGTVLMDRAAGIFLPPERRGVGYVPQDLALFPHLSVRGNIEYGSVRGGKSGPSLEQVGRVLEIDLLLDHRVAQLSGGQKQRVAFARALRAQPRLLLMDEPLSSLDEELKGRIIPYLRRMREEFGIPMIYVSHSGDELAALCDEVLVLRGGECVGAGKPGEIFEPVRAMRTKADWL